MVVQVLLGCVLKAGEQGVLDEVNRAQGLAPIVKGLEQGIGLGCVGNADLDYHCGKHFVEEVAEGLVGVVRVGSLRRFDHGL